MNHTHPSSFGLYEAARILVPGFYFASLFSVFFTVFVSRYILFSFDQAIWIMLFFFLVLVSGLTMYAKESTKRRRAFAENQPSSFLQEIARKHIPLQSLSEIEARKLYFYILNHFIPPAFHEKVFFFGTVYHIMIQIRRTSFWFTILSLICLAAQTAGGMALKDQQALVSFTLVVCLTYLLNVKYNKADRKMQENYQDQIFWLQMNGPLLQDLFQKFELSKKSTAS